MQVAYFDMFSLMQNFRVFSRLINLWKQSKFYLNSNSELCVLLPHFLFSNFRLHYSLVMPGHLSQDHCRTWNMLEEDWVPPGPKWHSWLVQAQTDPVSAILFQRWIHQGSGDVTQGKSRKWCWSQQQSEISWLSSPCGPLAAPIAQSTRPATQFLALNK